MSAAIKVSVVVPVHNNANFLPECLDTILGQTLRDIEIVCVDDASQDESLTILQDYAARDDRLSVIMLHDTGPGAADARNTGLDHARGEYLSFLDADDKFDATLLQKAYERGRRLDAEIVMYDARSFDSETGLFTDVGTYLVQSYLPSSEVFNRHDLIQQDVFRLTNGAAWCMMFRRDFILRNGIRFKPHHHTDDLFFTYSALVAASRITAIPEKLLFYRDNNLASQTSQRTSHPLSAPEAWLELKDSFSAQGVFEEVKVGFLNKALDYCRWYLEHIDKVEAFIELYEVLHDGALLQLGWDSNYPEKLYSKALYEWCAIVVAQDATRYLFQKMSDTAEKLYLYDPACSFPADKVQANDLVVLYGGGEVGKRYFMENLKGCYCHIIAWIDRHASESGMLSRPNALSRLCYDKILIAASSQGVRESIFADLRTMGVASERII